MRKEHVEVSVNDHFESLRIKIKSRNEVRELN